MKYKKPYEKPRVINNAPILTKVHEQVIDKESMREYFTGSPTARINNAVLESYTVDESTLQRDLCNKFFDEDSPRYWQICKCSRCFAKPEFTLGGLR